ncbi:protein KRI1 [Marchantia polymorpha subsp. ruderalis]|uniref:Kri1-like C-terminal domain-containing protein n=2 Tax=Marchantia polymorpha TaxID=3197 RepID=A0AAF6BHU2_MARPO|nr:hypothetical protein MARPO_0032s0003 [Marchantia polymorpha]BBN11576.1 hypothetical protein Mp_5g13090 [Marchantia polymorpha subsp. ruderalis]|eukprot:PTQ41791.1 hypothetical protein MARPO_0032s0003 [Marchantia polymorpha]
MASGRRSLLDDDEGDEEVAPQLRVNEAYAKRFVHNKEREDLHRLQELRKDGLAQDSDESSSEEEDEDGLLSVKTEEKIFETLSKIKKRDPSIYSQETAFFGDDDEEDEEELKSTVKKQKPQYLKDVIARQLLDGGPEDEEELVEKPRPKSYLTEQEELKRAFLQGVREVEGEEDADDLLRVKKKTKEEIDKEKQDTEEAIAWAEQRAKDASIAKKLEEYFGRDDDLDDNDKFLKEYLLNKGWVDQDQKTSRFPSYGEDTELLSEDEDELEKQEEYEADYNFRYEQGDNTYVKGHSRIIDDSVRKKSETRKKQRENKKLRQSEEERARQDELKRLKNVKKKEILEKLAKIRTVAGVSEKSGAEVLDEDDLEEDFDPEEYDKKMKEAFGEEYYGADDPDFASDDGEELEKPDFDAEDELLGIAPEAGIKGAGFAATKEKLDKKVKVPFEEKVMIDRHLEEYYKLDYEDVIGDLPTRFKYTQVKPNKYGMKTKDILAVDDAELNQFVSLKKLAPYTTQEWKPKRPFPRLSKKGRQKKALKSDDGVERVDKEHGNSADDADGDAEQNDHQPDRAGTTGSDLDAADEGVSGVDDEGEPSKGNGEANGVKKKRKRKKSNTPLPQSRMLTYAPPTKKKKVKR